MVASLLCALDLHQSVWARSISAIEADRMAAFGQVSEAMIKGKLFTSPAARKAGAPAVLAAIDRVLALDQELSQAGGINKKGASDTFTGMHILKLALDDPSAKKLQARAIAAGGNDAATAALVAAAAEYLDAGPDEAAQLGAVDHLVQAFKSVKPDSPVERLPEIFGDNIPVSETVANRVAEFLNASADPTWGFNATEWKSVARRMHLVNQPFTLSGTLVDGSKFSTAQWKGKVVYVDFWATWCVPCVAGLPDVAKLYAANHAKGLEVLNISADDDGAKLKAFLAKNKYLTWPQMFDFAHPGLTPMGPSYGINHLSATFIIDREGILRSAGLSSDEDPDEMVAKLLAEAP
jgi:thiol-disulfide isomerase/thioredoxin